MDAILDAMAVLIAAGGLEGVTMHRLAREAKTSIGSLYHFFPDQDSVLLALAQRHAAAMDAITLRLREIERGTWLEAGADDVARRLVADYVDYLQRHPDFFPVMAGRFFPQNEAGFVGLMTDVLAVRLTAASPESRHRYAGMVHTLVLGGVHMAFLSGSTALEVFIAEIPRVLSAYLASLERLYVIDRGIPHVSDPG